MPTSLHYLCNPGNPVNAYKQTIQPVAQRWRDVELIALLDTWLADESGLDEAVLPQLQRDLEANRIALHAVDAARSRTP